MIFANKWVCRREDAELHENTMKLSTASHQNIHRPSPAPPPPPPPPPPPLQHFKE
ncbi:hypothetical protein BVC80_8927g13 [Macleaya cordata]|uniref:Uncharacterized protein n=1 Tax=Macleaya cordata TaxID=56857 RepID=A0A200R0B0_MACCD|nr:hypothetical protein BVC80_8927g13 [Macleaya cordata]